MNLNETMTPEAALRSRAGIELDVFVFRYVFDGLVEKCGGGPAIPSFSRRAEAAKVLLIKMVMENQDKPISISYGDHWDRAKQVGQVVNDVKIPMWRVSIGSDEGFGKTLEEAITKLAILIHGRENA